MKLNYTVTLKDIAIRSNVSLVTVSKALRGHKDIPTVTTNKIKKIAHELGYIPNYLARNLVSKQSKTIGLIIPKISHYFFSEVVEAIYDKAYEHGYEIIMTVSHESNLMEYKNIEKLLSMRVDGILISLTRETKDTAIFHRVKQLGIPIIFFDRILEDKEFNKVIVDDFGGAFIATEHAIKIGYKRIAHFSGNLNTSPGKKRLLGYKAALQQYNISANEDLLIQCNYGGLDSYENVKKLYNFNKLPDCIFCGTFNITMGVYRAAREIGLKIPSDLDIISFGASKLKKYISSHFTYIEQPAAELGKKAVELAIKTIQNKNYFIPKTIILPANLVLCNTGKKQVKIHSQKVLYDELL